MQDYKCFNAKVQVVAWLSTSYSAVNAFLGVVNVCVCMSESFSHLKNSPFSPTEYLSRNCSSLLSSYIWEDLNSILLTSSLLVVFTKPIGGEGQRGGTSGFLASVHLLSSFISPSNVSMNVDQLHQEWSQR
jgi:hypothetical protein